MIADGFSERVVKMIGGWKSDQAFNLIDAPMMRQHMVFKWVH